MATYPRPASCSSITTDRPYDEIGTMSLRPVLDSVVKLRNSNSIHVRSAVELTAAVKLFDDSPWTNQ
jgi:hypothetical protein